MVSEKEMKFCLGKTIEITYVSGKKVARYCERFVRKEVDDEEAMLFFPGSLAASQSDIEDIKILEDDRMNKTIEP